MKKTKRLTIRSFIIIPTLVVLSACGGGSGSGEEIIIDDPIDVTDIDDPIDVTDTVAPVITLIGEAAITISQNGIYTELGATAVNSNGNVDVIPSGSVDTKTLGVYIITYTATDNEGNTATATRTITIVEATPFITTWQTNHPNADYTFASAENQIKIGTKGSGYNFTIDWGDGTVEHNQTAGKTHTYAVAGTYTIKITGAFPRLYSYFYYSRYDNDKLLSVEQWGNNQWANMSNAFHSAKNMVVNATDSPDLSQVTNMSSMFYGAASFNADISQWDVSNVTDMNRMFSGASSFNQDISGWDVSSVERMDDMFYNAGSFNSDISGWDVSSVKRMDDMFNGAEAFNQDIGGWIVTNVTDMESMFEGATYFNQNISSWQVQNVTNMESMFKGATYFNQNISSWQVQNVTNMQDMFTDAHLSVANYDALLNAWSKQTLQRDVNLDVDSYYSSAASDARDILDDDFDWYIDDLKKLPDEADDVSPEVSLIGDAEVTIPIGSDYVELGALAIDDRDGAMPVTMITGTVDTTQLGQYTLTYTAADTAGNISTATRTVSVLTVDNERPTVTLSGNNPLTLAQDEDYVEPGVNAIDTRDGTLDVVITGDVEDKVTGSYTITYTATDNAGNSTSVDRTVIVPTDTTAPVITLRGDALLKYTINSEEYVELGATARDWRDGTVDVDITGSVDMAVFGDYIITYTAQDNAGNSDSITRTVQVLDPDETGPEIMLEGFNGNDTVIDWTQGFDYEDFGFSAYDARDGSVVVTSSGEVDSDTIGTYTITYTATDAAGNTTSVTRTVNVVAATPFITTWKMPTDDLDLTILTSGSGYDYTIDWGDGTVENNQTGNATHDYASAGEYTVKITGPFPRLFIDNNSSVDTKLTSVAAWGNNIWSSMDSAFQGAENLVINATDTPVLHQVTSMYQMFSAATNFNSDISNWDVSSVTNMYYSFYNAKAFNQDISGWDVSSVTNMRYMFSGATLFNQPIGDWANKVSNVTNMQGMFANATAFNQDLSYWDVSSVANMSEMFRGATSFNEDIRDWNVSNVKNMEKMFNDATSFNQDISQWDVSNVAKMVSTFYGADSFNQDIGQWDVSNVKSMEKMFYSASAFNQNINDWNVSNVTNMSNMFLGNVIFNQPLNKWKDKLLNVTDMESMFYNAELFNQDISEWDVSNVTDMESMFYNAELFNQDISEWDVSNVTNMSNMFKNAVAFNQDISGWDVSNVTNMSKMFQDAVAFNQDISDWNIESVTNMSNMFNNANLSVINYDALLEGWSIQRVKSNVSLDVDSYYSSSASAARDSLINTYGWNINDNGQLPTD